MASRNGSIAKYAVLGIAVLLLVPVFQVPVFAHPGGILLVMDPSCNSDGLNALSNLGIHHNTALTNFPSNFTSSMNNLGNYAVIYVADLNLGNSACAGVLNSLNGYKTAIANWLKAANRGIVAEAEYCIGASCKSLGLTPFHWLPGGITTCSEFDNCYGDTVTITNSKTIITQGLTSSSLSSWGQSFHCQFTAGKYKTLATGTSFGSTTHPVMMYKTLGFGSVVVTCLDPAWHYVNAANGNAGTLVDNMLTWAI